MKVLVFHLALFKGGALVSCSCGDLDLGGGEEDGGEVDAVEVGENAWAPNVDNLGEPGWRDSTEPWCAETGSEYELFAYDVWSDSTGVYVLARYEYMLARACPFDTTDIRCIKRSAIFQNDGSGWNNFWEFAEMVGGEVDAISGIPRSCILGLGGWPTGCYLHFITHDSTACQLYDITRDVFSVNENLLYALINAGGGDLQKVAYYDGSTWGPLPAAFTPYQVELLWADEHDIFCAGPDGTIVSLEDGDWRIHDTRTLADFNAIWGFGGSDVWAGAWGGELLHYDGDSWTAVEWPCMSDGCGIQGMWGAAGILFFYTESQLVTWNGTSFEVLLFFEPRGEDSAFIKALWGNSPTEVFVAVQDRAHPDPQCGEYFLLWWDGSAFHWF